MRRIAITGPLACGKTSACQFLRECGAYVVHTDHLVHRLLTPETAAGKAVIQLLGEEILLDHQIDRSAIAHQVFHDRNKLHALEAILHPEVQKEINSLYAMNSSYPLFAVEIPLLFESPIAWSFDTIVAIDTPDEQARARFIQAGGTADQYHRRRARQTSQWKEQADVIIKNDSSIEELKKKTIELFKKLTT